MALVTGGSRGIGRGISEALGAEGFAVAINYHRNESAAESAVEAVRAAGGDGLTVQADIGDADDRRRLLEETVEGLGPVAVLVNNAGVAPKVRADLL
ncbi:MAG: SDR family NAD(P)-dependent oxidoreductase, partial [Phycisphaeraceae bacterium]|nr:SDR family NAD(P)-dependent oxidoreductase [Phycisphaeraceae bacterium]